MAIYSSLGALATALAAPAYAQSAGTADEKVNAADVIIVEARRRGEDIQDVPLVVNSVGAEKIAQLNLRQFEEIKSLVPGLDLRSESNGIAASGQLRGVSYDPNGSNNPTVEFYLNDASVQATVVLQQIYDIAQIEVLRGPQGTLRGRASPSGSITVTTHKPDLYEYGGYLAATGNDIGTMNFNGAIGIPIIKGIAAIRVAGVYGEGEGNRVKTINPGLDGRDPFTRNKGVRVTGLVEPTDWLRFQGIYQRIDNSIRSYDQYASYSLADPSAPASPLLIRPKDRLSIQEVPREIRQVFDIFNWRAEARFAGQALIYQGQHYTAKLKATANYDNANYFQGFDFFQTIDTNVPGETHELRLQNEDRVLGMFDYVVGYFRQTQGGPTKLLQDTPIALPPALGGGVVAVVATPIETAPHVKENSVFGNLTAHLGSATEISGGLRYIHYQAPASELLIGGNAIPAGPAINDKKVIYSASIKHNFTPDLLVYANTGTSRRAPTTIIGNFSPVQSDLERQFTYLPAENSRSYEIGLKSTWMDGRLLLNVSAYHQTFSNFPYKLTTPVNYVSYTFVPGTGLVPVAANGAQFAAAVPIEVNGIEAEVGFKVSPNFNLNLVAAYADGKIKKGLIPCNDLNGDGVPDAAGAAPTVDQLLAAYGANFIGACRVSQRSANQAPFSFTAQADYNLPLSDKVDFFARGLYAFQGNSLGDPANEFDSVKAYGLLNLFTGLRDASGAWEVSLFAKNVLNVTRATSFQPRAQTAYVELQPPTFTTTASRTATSPYAIITTTQPREFGLTVRYSFGAR